MMKKKTRFFKKRKVKKILVNKDLPLRVLTYSRIAYENRANVVLRSFKKLKTY